MWKGSFRSYRLNVLLIYPPEYFFFKIKLISEPRGSSQESFEDVLKGYYNSIHHGTRQVGGRKIRGKKLGLKGGSLKVYMEDTKKEGAAFLAVCRGKVIQKLPFYYVHIILWFFICIKIQ